MANTLVLSFAVDNTSLATFKAWAGAVTYVAGVPTTGGVSYAFFKLGWLQSNDTGQVVWVASVFTSTLTSVAVSGGNAVYAYSALTSGPSLRVGMSITVSGFVNGGNNVTGTITAVVANTSFTLATTTQVNETHSGSATTTAIVTSASNAAVYEIWQMNDSLAATSPCFIKITYTQGTTTPQPALQVTLGLATDGAGNITGTMASALTNIFGPAATTTNDTTVRNHFFCGTSGRMVFCIDDANNTGTGPTSVFNVERSHDSSGNDTGSYFTFNIAGVNSTRAGGAAQQSIVNGVAGNPPTVEQKWVCAVPSAPTSWTFNSTTALGVVNPFAGVIGNPLLGLLVVKASDWVDQTQLQLTIYAATHTYLIMLGGNATFQSTGTFLQQTANPNLSAGICIRWE